MIDKIEQINRLLKNPATRWTKRDTVHAAKIIAEEFLFHKDRPKGIIQRAMLNIPPYYEIKAIAFMLAVDPNVKFGKGPGRPKGAAKISVNEATEFLKYVECRRERIARTRQVDKFRVTDKDVAYDFGHSKDMETFRKKYKYTKQQLSEKTYRRIKYLKRKTKSGSQAHC